MPVHDADVGAALLAESRKQLMACHARIRHCAEQLTDEQIWYRADEELNSIGNLLLHLDGNIRQRMLSLIGGEPDDRNRDQEFAEREPIAKARLLARFDETISRTDALLGGLSVDRLLETRRYRMLKGDVEGTLVTLILHTLVHLGGHAQEIVTLTRLQLRERYRFLQTPSKG